MSPSAPSFKKDTKKWKEEVGDVHPPPPGGRSLCCVGAKLPEPLLEGHRLGPRPELFKAEEKSGGCLQADVGAPE